MLAAIHSAAVIGIDAYQVVVEVEAAKGLPHWTIVGMPAAAVKESRERVGSALINSGFHLPPRKVCVNLAPGDQKKEGTAFDLPIAIGTLVATEQLPPSAVENRLFVGELSLDGSLRQIRGALPVARYAARCEGEPTLVIPAINLIEAGRVSSIRIAAPATLRELVQQLREDTLEIVRPPLLPEIPYALDIDFSDVVGQNGAKRALEVAAAGAHNILLSGPPGAGKTLLARRLPTILPALTEEEALDVIAIHSVAGLLSDDVTAGVRPFRAPHHTISSAGLIGGGSSPRPGEVSLAHNGVLFLDEMLEFHRSVLDGLRQPMEDAKVVISRATNSVSFPAKFTLVGATNPCPCGYAGELHRQCSCRSKDLSKYKARMSGPLSDRIDMHVSIDAVPLRELSSSATSESSMMIRDRVARARIVQQVRYKKIRGVTTNAHASGRWLDAHTPIAPEARRLLQAAAEAMHLSARGYHRVLKVARTIADLGEHREIGPDDMTEALRYRPGPGGR